MPSFNIFRVHFVVIFNFTVIYLSKQISKCMKNSKLCRKGLKVDTVSSFHPHSMCQKVERVTTKTGCTSCTNWTISFEVSGFQTKTHLFHRHFIFLNLLQLQTFFAFRTHHSKRRHQFSTLSDIICYFSVHYRFV